jgi:hypothetical protein
MAIADLLGFCAVSDRGREGRCFKIEPATDNQWPLLRLNVSAAAT